MEAEKHYGISFPGAREVSVVAYHGEKIKVKLASNTISDIQSALKVKSDDIKKRIDVDIKRYGKQTKAKAKEELCIFIMMPQKFTRNIELMGNAQTLKLECIEVDNFEFSGKVSLATISDVKGHIELNSNTDLLKNLAGVAMVRIPLHNITVGLASRFILDLYGHFGIYCYS